MQMGFEPELLPLLLSPTITISVTDICWIYSISIDYRANECRKRWLYRDKEETHGISILDTCATCRSLDEPCNIHACSSYLAAWRCCSISAFSTHGSCS